MLSDWRIDETIETGGCTSFENAKFGGEAAPEKHFFSARRACDAAEQYNRLSENSAAKAQIEALELKCCHNKSIAGFGEFLLAKGKRE